MSDIGYQFTISNNMVTAAAFVDGNITDTLTIPGNNSFVVGTGSIVDTITNPTNTVVFDFTPETADPALDFVSGETITLTNPTILQPDGVSVSYSFTEANGTVTAITENASFNGHSNSANFVLSPSAIFAINSTSVTETFVQGNEVESIKFVQPTGSTSFVVGSESAMVVPIGTANTVLDVQPFNRVEFTSASSGAITGIETVSTTGSVIPLTVASNVSFTQLAPGFVEETATFSNASAFALYYSASGSGVYTEIAHGSGSTVDLVGIKAQLAELPAGVAALL